MTADKAIKWSTIAAVVIVAAVAASFSYQHALDVVGQYSRPSRLNLVFPLLVDGLVYVGSMSLLNDAKRGRDAHPLGYWMLGIGIAATLTVNAVSGLAYGIVGAVIAGWPAVALVLSYEGLMVIVRRSASPAEAGRSEVQPTFRENTEGAAPAPPAALNGHGHAAAELFATELARGEVPSVRRVRREMHLGQPRAQQVREYLSALRPEGTQ